MNSFQDGELAPPKSGSRSLQMFHSRLKAQDSQTGLHFYRSVKPYLKCDLLTFNVGHSKAFHGYKQNTEYDLTLEALVNSNI